MRKLENKLTFKWKISKIWLVNSGCIFLIIFLMFPICNALNGTFLNSLKLFAAVLFLLGVFKKDVKLFFEISLILLLSIIINIYYFYQVWYKYTSFFSFMNDALLCWLFMLMSLFYVKYATVAMKNNIEKIIIIIMVVTSITTLFVLSMYPNAVRTLGNANEFTDALERELYLRNTATWGILYAMTFALNSIICRYKQSRKKFYLLAIIFIEVCVIFSQITFAIIFSFIFIIFLFIKPFNYKKYFGSIIFGGISIVFLLPYMDDFLYKIYIWLETTHVEVLARRVYQLYITFQTGIAYGDAAARFELYGASLKTFLENPILGYRIGNEQKYSKIGMHSEIFDRMAGTGIFGILVFGILFFYIARKIYHNISHNLCKRYFILTMIVLVILMFLNPVYYSPQVFLTCFLLPVLVDRKVGENE